MGAVAETATVPEASGIVTVLLEVVGVHVNVPVIPPVPLKESWLEVLVRLKLVRVPDPEDDSLVVPAIFRSPSAKSRALKLPVPEFVIVMVEFVGAVVAASIVIFPSFRNTGDVTDVEKFGSETVDKVTLPFAPPSVIDRFVPAVNTLSSDSVGSCAKTT
jgi:hypothetical protein